MNFNSYYNTPCTIEYSNGKGTGVSEAIGNWGFSNEITSPGYELNRMQCLLNKMESLRDSSCVPAKKKKEHVFKGKIFGIKSCKSAKYYPLILYSSINERIPCENRKLIDKDNVNPLLHRSYCFQGTDKWYKMKSSRCLQPCCPVTVQPDVDITNFLHFSL